MPGAGPMVILLVAVGCFLISLPVAFENDTLKQILNKHH